MLSCFLVAVCKCEISIVHNEEEEEEGEEKEVKEARQKRKGVLVEHVFHVAGREGEMGKIGGVGGRVKGRAGVENAQMCRDFVLCFFFLH